MDTNSNIPAEKKVVSVEILHLDEVGYGPKGEHTRREWRAECLENLLGGKEQFESWQDSWKEQIEDGASISFDCEVTYNYGDAEVFGGYSNPFSLDFVGHRFQNPLNANKFQFSQTALFNSAIFGDTVDFQNANFIKFGGFDNANFRDFVYFRDAIFMEYAYFEGTTFCRGVEFLNIIFCELASFQSATFKGNVGFQQATFGGNTFFSSGSQITRFEGDVFFCGATFKKNAHFFKTRFVNQCRFDNGLNKETNTWSKETDFIGEVNFENAEFQNIGHFERVCFKGEIPNFLGVDNAKTLLLFSGDKYFNKKDTTEDAVKRIGQLKRLSDEQGQTDQALMFNAFELNAKAKQADASSLFKVFTWLYKNVADYGRSFSQPLKIFIYLFLITFVGALVFAGKSAPIICTERMLQYDGDIQSGSPVSCLSYYQTTDEFKLSGYRAAFEYASYRSSGILDFSDNDKQTSAINMRVFDQKVEPTWVRVYGIFKAIASTALLFLAALGLRNKYRIK